MAYARRNDSFSGGFKGGSKFGGGSRGRSFSDRGGSQTIMHPATCSDCGSRCEVPFRPNGKKPVLCKNCFSNGNDFEPKFGKRNDSGHSMNSDNTAEQLRSINAKLDAIMRVLASNSLSV